MQRTFRITRHAGKPRLQDAMTRVLAQNLQQAVPGVADEAPELGCLVGASRMPVQLHHLAQEVWPAVGVSDGTCNLPGRFVEDVREEGNPGPLPSQVLEGQEALR